MSRVVIPGFALLALALSTVGTWPQAIQAGLQSEQDGLAVHGIVRLPGTREPVPFAAIKLRDYSPNRLDLVPGHEDPISADAEGRFSFVGLDPGRYLVSPIFPGDSDTLTRVADGRTVDLTADGLPREALVWWTEPISQLTGRVLDSNGEPVVGACVSPRSLLWYQGSYEVGGQPLIDCLTDEDGRFRVDATPGRYYLHVRSLAAISRYQYYPGTVRPDVATLVTVTGGIDLAGLDIHLVETETFRVSFSVQVPVSLPGLPEPLSTYIANPDPRSVVFPSLFPSGGVPGLVAWIRRVVGVGFVRELPTSYDLQPSGDGAYSLPPLPPGQYEMLLSYDNGLKNQLRSEFDLNWRPFDPIARVPFEIDDADVDLGVLGDPPRTSVPGRVDVRRSAGGSEIGLEQLPTVSLGDVHYILGSETRRAVPGDDGAFLIEDAYPGSFVLGVRQGDLPLGWYVESVRSGGIDLLREELLVGGGQVSPIQVVIANDAGRIEGIVRGGDDQPVPDAHVVLIPPIGGRGPATRFPAVTADASGVFALERLRPGEYRLLALDLAGRDGAGVFWESPDFLRQYGLRGGRITVDPGARLTINPEAIPLVE